MDHLTQLSKMLRIILLMLLSHQAISQSMSIGNTYIHNKGESVVFGQHDFDNGGFGVLPGIVGTERADEKGFLSFSNVSIGWINGGDDKYVDGYVKYYGADPFTFPIGDDNEFRPIAVSGSAESRAAYFKADPSSAQIMSVFGEQLEPLPLGGPFMRTNKGGSINTISDREYWDIDGTNATKITLTWDINSQIGLLTNNDLKKLTIVGWDGSKWVPIPSTVDNVYLNNNSSTPRYDAGISNVALGSITTRAAIVPDDYVAYTFASVGLALIGDFVWEDMNRNGIQEPNEPPLSNVLVELYDADRNYLTSTTSDASGRYFIEGVEPGQYYVKFNSPSGFLPTLAGQGELNQNSDVTFSGFTPILNLDVNQVEFSIDGGFYTNGSIGNSVWIDDGNGIKEEGEPGLEDVVVELLDANLDLQASTVTAADGSYVFTNLPPGEYIVKFVLPPGYDFSPVHSTLDHTIDSDADPETGMTESIFLLSGQDIMDFDAGFSAPCKYAATIDFTDPFCGLDDGRISVDIQGESGPYTYLWNTGAITPMIENLVPGVYTLIINDSENCPRTFEVELNYQGICDPICGEVEASVYIEGSYDKSSDEMYTMLNSLGYLPGQKPVTFFGKYTEAGQPYNREPWYYSGIEGLTYESKNKSDNNENYPMESVDWVLVSLREDKDIEYETCTRAGLLQKDGTIKFMEEDCCILDPLKNYYVVVEHRNHLIVMSPEPVPVRDGKVSFDFRTQNSYTALFGYGQKEIQDGVFAMYAANGDQYLDGESPVDINVSDLAEWLKENGFHSSYYFMDFDLNGDANVQDKGLYLENIGIFTDVPKE